MRLEELEDRLAPAITTTTSLSGMLQDGSSLPASIIYGTPITFTATVAPSLGSVAPPAGSVDFQDGSFDLGVISTETLSGSNAIFTLVTTPNQLQVIQANGGVHTITAVYSPADGFDGSSETLVGGLTVSPASVDDHRDDQHENL